MIHGRLDFVVDYRRWKHSRNDYCELDSDCEVERMTPVPVVTPAYGIAAVIALGILLVISIVCGILAQRQARALDGYLVGARNIGPIATGLAIGACYASAWAAMGSMGITYTVGWAGLGMAGMFGLLGGIPCVMIAARRFSEFSHLHQTRTMGEVIGVRYDSKWAQTIAAGVMALLSLLYSVGQLKAAGTAWYAVTGFSPVVCLLFSVVVVLIYMLIGGFVGTQWAMAVQGVFVAVGLLVLLIATLPHVGGISGINAALAAQDPKLLAVIRSDLPRVGTTQVFSDFTGQSAVFFLFLIMPSGYVHITARAMGMQRLTKKGFVAMMACMFFVAGPPIWATSLIGLASRATYGPQLFQILPWKADLAAPFIAMTAGGPTVTAIYVAGIFAAALSTLASLLVVIASSCINDIIRIWRPNTSPGLLLGLTRLVIIVVGALVFVWTLINPPPLLAIFMSQIGAGLAGIFVFVATVSLVWKRATKQGAIACSLYGLVATLYTSYLVGQRIIGNGTAMWAIFIGCAVFYIGGSLLSRPLSQEKLARLFPEFPIGRKAEKITMTR